MLNKLKKSDAKGFTIIEVMIVLAIAGLIILVVLLAVPALQRNARNTQLKNDASSVAAGVSEFKSNNDGQAPTTISTTTVSGAAGTAPATIKLSGGATVTATATPSAGNIGYQVGAACPGSTANTRSVAIYYTPEASSTVTKCIDA
jgi:prepilin-type N-terminal cleavage/methylation domain-containing protein